MELLSAHQVKKLRGIASNQRIWKLLRFIWVFIYLSYCKLKDVLSSQWKINRELLCLKIIFIYFIYIGLQYIGPRIHDILYLDIPYGKQLQFMLLNTGIVKTKITNLNYLSNDNVIIALDLANSEHSINEIIESMQIMGCSFKTAHFIIFVSPHSYDHTRDIIIKWKNNPPNCTNIHKHKHLENVFWNGGNVKLVAMTPRKELETIQRLINTKHANPAQNIHVHIGEYRDIFYRNLLLKKALEIYGDGDESDENWYLMFVGEATHFDIESIGREFFTAWNLGYDVVCANGIKYNGWYYDSFPTILSDNTWFSGIPRITNTHVIRSKQFIDANSCNSGFVAYNLKIIKETKCEYISTKQALIESTLLSNFTKKYNNPKRISVHVPFNFCLKLRGDAKIVIASRAYTYLGVNKSPLTQLDDRL